MSIVKLDKISDRFLYNLAKNKTPLVWCANERLNKKKLPLRWPIRRGYRQINFKLSVSPTVGSDPRREGSWVGSIPPYIVRRIICVSSLLSYLFNCLSKGAPHSVDRLTRSSMFFRALKTPFRISVQSLFGCSPLEQLYINKFLGKCQSSK